MGEFRNICEPITLLPLEAECVPFNNTSNDNPNGSIDLNISGGTPPYNVFWSNGSTKRKLSNISEGTYTARVVDFYGDFEIDIECSIINNF